jgi:putative peptidoglycan lipid II flippase
VNVLQLAGVLLKEKLWRPSPALVAQMMRVLIATAIMAGVLGAMAWQRETIVSAVGAILHMRLGAKEIAVALVAAAGTAIYAIAAFAVGALRPSDIKRAMRREKSPADGLPPAGEP